MDKQTSNSLGKGLADIQRQVQDSGGNISKVARALGLNYYALKQLLPETDTTFVSAKGPEPEDIRTLGKPGLERHVVAVKRIGFDWPDKYKEAIKTARRSYDAGTHEMATGHRGGWAILYLIPRLVSAGQRTYFSSMEVFH